MFVLKQTLQEAWGPQAGQKQRELNDYLQVLSSHWLSPNKIVTRMCIMKDGLEYFLVEINGRVGFAIQVSICWRLFHTA